MKKNNFIFLALFIVLSAIITGCASQSTEVERNQGQTSQAAEVFFSGEAIFLTWEIMIGLSQILPKLFA